MKVPSKRITQAPPTPWARAALKACDWFVDSQVIQRSPYWDANHGRYCYNVHVPTATKVLGLCWTQARAVMCLLAAFERTGRERYLESARQGLAYVRILQDMDRRRPLAYGAFHEETPHSPFSYPRDAIEAAEALLQWHRVTGEREALDSALLFFDWFERQAVTDFPGFGAWVRGEVRFDGAAPRIAKPIACMMGCGTILAHAHIATGRPLFKRRLLALADSTIRHFLPGDAGPMMRAADPHKASHHSGSDGVIHNDDGGGVSLLNAYKLSGRPRYLAAATRIAEYYRELKTPIPIVSGIGAVANFLLEMDRVAGTRRYRATAERLARQLLRRQVLSGGAAVKGAFRGEDEGGKWYYAGAANDDFVTTRVTAYAVLTLFKLEGLVWPRGYAVHF